MRGAQVLGQFPPTLGAEGADILGRGRVVPTLGWESLWHALALWLDVPPSRMAEVLPNLPSFAAAGRVVEREELFTR